MVASNLPFRDRTDSTKSQLQARVLALEKKLAFAEMKFATMQRNLQVMGAYCSEMMGACAASHVAATKALGEMHLCLTVGVRGTMNVRSELNHVAEFLEKYAADFARTSDPAFNGHKVVESQLNGGHGNGGKAEDGGLHDEEGRTEGEGKATWKPG
jgi:hypothetical protein